MALEIPEECRELLVSQSGVIGRSSDGTCVALSVGISFPSPRVRRASRSAAGASTWTTCMRNIRCAWNWTGAPPIPQGSSGAINGAIGGTSRSRKSSPCALGTWTFARRKRGAGLRRRLSAFSATGGPRSAPAAVLRAAPSNERPAVRRRTGCLMLGQELTALFGERSRRDCRMLKGAEGARVDGLFGALAQVPLRYERQSSWRCGRHAGV